MREDPEVLIFSILVALFILGLGTISPNSALLARALEGAEERTRTHETWLRTHPLYRGLRLGLSCDGSPANLSRIAHEFDSKNVGYVTEGRFGGAYRFDPLAYVRIPVVEIHRAGTWAAWARIAPDADLSVEMRLLDANGYSLIIRDGVLQGTFTDVRSRHLRTHAPATGDWFHVAMTWGASSFVKLYLDGKQAGSTPYAGPPAFGIRTLSVGASWHSLYGFAGDIAEVCIYDRELPPREVAELRTAGLAPLRDSARVGSSRSGR